MIFLPWVSYTLVGSLIAPNSMHNIDSHWFLLIESPTKTSLFPLINSSIFVALNLCQKKKQTQYPKRNHFLPKYCISRKIKPEKKSSKRLKLRVPWKVTPFGLPSPLSVASIQSSISLTIKTFIDERTRNFGIKGIAFIKNPIPFC